MTVPATRARDQLYPALKTVIETLEKQFDQIPAERKESLDELADYISDKLAADEEARLIVICTHNSRRSHIGQLWSFAAGYRYGIPVDAYSGGTEATAFHPNAVGAMISLGFSIESDAVGKNPLYVASFGEGLPEARLFSKKYDDEVNPKNNFAAIMVCTDADEACPIVFGADFRLSLPFEDPKAYDGTDLERAKYEERAMDIGREILYAFSQVKTP